MKRFLDQFEIQPDALCLDIASAPLGFHLFHSPFGYLHIDDCFPFGNYRRNFFFESLALPAYQYAFPLRGVATGSYEDIYDFVVAKADCWCAFVINYIE